MGKFFMHMGGLMAFNLEGIEDTVQVLLLEPEVVHRQTLLVPVTDVVLPDEKAELQIEGLPVMGPGGEPCLAFDLKNTIVTLERSAGVSKPKNRKRQGEEPDWGQESDFQWIPSMHEIDPGADLDPGLTTKPIRSDAPRLGARIDLVRAGGSLRADKRCYDVDPSVWEFTKTNSQTFRQYAADATKLRIRTRGKEQVVLAFETFDNKSLGTLTFKGGKTRRCAISCFPVKKVTVKRSAYREAPHFDSFFDLCRPQRTPTTRPHTANGSDADQHKTDEVFPVKCMPTTFP